MDIIMPPTMIIKRSSTRYVHPTPQKNQMEIFRLRVVANSKWNRVDVECMLIKEQTVKNIVKT